MEYWLTNGYLVNEGRCFKGSILIRDGFIAEIFEESSTGFSPYIERTEVRSTLDLNGAYILPGVIDPHVHFREPGLTHKGDIASESTAALLGGVTSIMEMPNTNPQTLTQKLLEEKFALGAEHSRVNYSFYMGCSRDNLDEVLKTDPEKVCGIKLFMGSSTGNMLVDDPDYLETLFAHAPTLIAAHCEDEGIISRNTALAREKYGEDAPFSIHPQIRSEEACFKASLRAAELASKYGSRLHILHVSTQREIDYFSGSAQSRTDFSPFSVRAEARTTLGERAEARSTLGERTKVRSTLDVRAKARTTLEVCPSYLWFSDEDYEKYGAKIKINPAIKTARDREALREAVRQGLVAVGSDHAPHTWTEKQQPYFKCPSGAPWVQYSLGMMLELAYQGVFTLPQIVEAMCHQPARIYGVDRRGFLRRGYYADLAICKVERAFSPFNVRAETKFGVRSEAEVANARTTLGERTKVRSTLGCGWSPLENQTLHGAVIATFVNGVLAQKNGVVLEPDFRGERLAFKKF